MKTSIRNILSIAAITASFAVSSSFGADYRWNGVLAGGAYGATDKAEIYKGTADTAVPPGPAESPLAANSDAYGESDRAQIAAEANHSDVATSTTGPVISPVAEDSDAYGAADRAEIAAEVRNGSPAPSLANVTASHPGS